MVVSSPREDETPPRGPQTGSPIHDHCTPTVGNSPHTFKVRGARPLLRDEVFHLVPTAFRPIDTVIELRSDKLPHILNLSLEKLFLEEAIANYESAKSALTSALQEDMSGNIAM